MTLQLITKVIHPRVNPHFEKFVAKSFSICQLLWWKMNSRRGLLDAIYKIYLKTMKLGYDECTSGLTLTFQK